jgi:hypothetical protein
LLIIKPVDTLRELRNRVAHGEVGEATILETEIAKGIDGAIEIVRYLESVGTRRGARP